MESSWVSIIPFLLVIPISIWTKQVLPGLTIGLIIASYLIEPSIVGGIEQMITYLVGSLSNENNMKIIIFLYAFSGLIGMIKMAGGIKGFVESVSNRIKTKKGALFLTWVSTLGTFTAPSLRVVTIAPIMKALLQRVKMSKQELGFVIETTATPVVVLIPIATAYVGYMTSVIEMAFKNEGIEQDAYTLFIQSIPFNFFAIVMVFLGIYFSFFHPSKDKTMESSEEIGKKEETWHECHPAVAKELPSKPLNLLLPLFLVLALTLFLTWWSGREKADGLVQAFIKADTLGAMVIALIITVFVTLLMFLFQAFEGNYWSFYNWGKRIDGGHYSSRSGMGIINSNGRVGIFSIYNRKFRMDSGAFCCTYAVSLRAIDLLFYRFFLGGLGNFNATRYFISSCFWSFLANCNWCRIC